MITECKQTENMFRRAVLGGGHQRKERLERAWRVGQWVTAHTFVSRTHTPSPKGLQSVVSWESNKLSKPVTGRLVRIRHRYEGAVKRVPIDDGGGVWGVFGGTRSYINEWVPFRRVVTGLVAFDLKSPLLEVRLDEVEIGKNAPSTLTLAAENTSEQQDED